MQRLTGGVRKKWSYVDQRLVVYLNRSRFHFLFEICEEIAKSPLAQFTFVISSDRNLRSAFLTLHVFTRSFAEIRRDACVHFTYNARTTVGLMHMKVTWRM